MKLVDMPKTKMHKAVCPKGHVVIDDCWGCITGNSLVCHECAIDGVPEIYEEIIWEEIKT